MSDIKCPFCNKPLQPTLRQSDEYWCENYDCSGTNIEWVGSQKLWQELIKLMKEKEHTRKALDVAVDALDRMAIDDNVSGMIARNAIKEIKALEQKE